ncbi:unnamed protein product [Absidia cylindrospora]
MSHKEQEFYEYLEHHHAPLLPFTSQYLGVVNVTYRSFNAQPMLPEVVLAENQHLLANWKKYLHSSTPSQKSKQQRKQYQQQRRYSSSSNFNKTRASFCDTDHDDSLTKHCALPSRSPLTFKEQVLREVFSPDALQERLQQVQDWQRGMRQRQLDDTSDNGDNNKNGTSCSDSDGQPRDPMKRSMSQTSRSVLDFRRQQLTDPPEAVAAAQSNSDDTSARNSERSSHDPIYRILPNTSTSATNHHDLTSTTDSRVDSADNDEGPMNADTSSNLKDDISGDDMNALQVTVHPRRPSLIDSTTSAPQTPRMRETKLHNPHIRPPSILGQPPIPNLTASPSDLSLSPTCLSPTYIQSSTSTSATTPPLTSYISSLPSAHQELQQTDQQQQDGETVMTTSESASWRPRKEPTNPWSVQMYQRDLEKVNVDDTQQFILIEDLTDEIKYPCVLDLKMGTRQHGVYSTSTKMLSQTKKCERSTSLRLGVRISGMQVYNVNDGQFLFEDKYKGRSLTQHGFRDSLVRYFDNGQGCHIIHLPALIRKLVLIHRIIQTMDSFRFYASSLLIIYDAADNNTNDDSDDADEDEVAGDKRRKRRIDVRLIDFAKSVTKHEWRSYRQEFTYPPAKDEGGGGGRYDQTQNVGLLDDNNDAIGPDHGYLLGVQSLISCFVWIYVKHGGKKEDLADLDDLLPFEDLPSWLEEQDSAGNEQDTQ